jgi:hypothetical protein
MPVSLLSAKEAAEQIGLTRSTFYGWLGLSDHGLLVIRGQPATIRYYQGGAQGQGKIQIEAAEIERLQELMRVVPQKPTRHRSPTSRNSFPGITVPLGRPAE